MCCKFYNVRPQAMAPLYLGYDVVSNINPRLIYASVFAEPGRARALCGKACL